MNENRPILASSHLTPEYMPNENEIWTPKRTAHLGVPWTIVKIQNQSKCLETDGRIHNIWHTDAVEYYLAMKKRNTCIYNKWMDAEITMSSEISLAYKQVPHTQPYVRSKVKTSI